VLISLPGNALADAAANRLIAKVEASTRALHSFRMKGITNLVFAGANGGNPYKRTDTEEVLFARPNRFRITDEQSQTTSNGKELLSISKKYFERSPIDALAADYHWYHNDLYLLFVTGSIQKTLTPPYAPTTRLLADENWNGADYRVVQIDVGGGFPIRYKLYVGKDNLVHRIVHEEDNHVAKRYLDFSISELELNPSTKPSDFALVQPAGLTPMSDLYKGEPELIKVGQTAVNFSLPTPSGQRLPMSEMLKGKKALLLNFWFVQCPPCRAEHPLLNKLFKELKGKGLGMLAIDDQDTPGHSAKYMKDAHLEFITVLTGPRFPTDPKTGQTNYRGSAPDYASLAPYGVRECPTNILIGADGKVAYVSSGWDEKGLREALAKLGIK
jgi:thiol-disulfide isomerase/thioredoxin